MSISPVLSFPPAKSEPADTASVRSNNVASLADAPAKQQAVQPVSAAVPNPEESAPKNVPSKYVLPEDVVEVHQDPESKAQVTQYLDQSKNVILQVPSSEVTWPT